MGDLIRTAPAVVRDTAIGFYGAGCPHVGIGIECFIQQVNKLIFHYNCSRDTRFLLKVSLEYMIVELGISDQPSRSHTKKLKRIG